jgi:hypothetical protein
MRRRQNAAQGARQENQKKVTLDGYRQQMAGEDQEKMEIFEDAFRKPAIERACREVRGEL